MTGLRISVIGKGLAAVFAVLFLWAAPAKAADPAVYGALPDVTEVEISPSGRYAALLQNVGDQKAVMFYDLDAPDEKPVGVGVGKEDARGIEWANDDRILLLLSVSEKVETTSGMETIEFFRWISVSRTTGKSKALFGDEPGFYMPSSGFFIGVRPDDPEKAIFARPSLRAGYFASQPSRTRLKQKDPFEYNLFEVNLENGRQRKIGRGGEDTVDWVVDRNGDAVLRVDYSRKSNKREIFVKAPGEARFRLLREFEQTRGRGAPISLHGLSATQDYALATMYGDRDKRSLVRFDLETGEIGETAVFSNADYDIDSIVYDPLNGYVTGVRYTDDLPQTYHLDEADRKMQASLGKALPNASPVIVSKSLDGARMIVRAVYVDHPTQFFLFDKKARRLDMIAASYNALDNKVAAIKEKYDYTASDGLKIPGYLTVPEGASKQSMPLIVLPHGGPEARDDQSFDWWTFFYAARGYLVYQPNFRGSSGYGIAFRDAGHGEWGGKMQDDITEGVEKLIADGLADPERICIVGASYGGYAALAGAVMTPELYACAVSVNGVSDLMAMLGEEARLSEYFEDYWRVRIGDRFQNDEEIAAASPVNFAGKVQAPVMLIHGKDDTVVPVGHSRRMRNALKSARKPHDYVELPGEDHWLSTGAMRTEMLRRSIDFIDAHIGEEG